MRPANDLRTKTAPELREQLSTERETLRELRFKISSDQHKDVRALRKARKTIARILTLLGQQRPALTLGKSEKPREAGSRFPDHEIQGAGEKVKSTG